MPLYSRLYNEYGGHDPVLKTKPGHVLPGAKSSNRVPDAPPKNQTYQGWIFCYVYKNFCRGSLPRLTIGRIYV